MGTDKALLLVGGRTLLGRAIGVLDEVAREVWLACGPLPRYAEHGRALLLDQRTDGGPLAGLESALERLERCGGDWLAVLACDMPAARPEVFLCALERARKRDLDAVFYEDAGGLEPLFGVVHARALAAVRAALDRGERRSIAYHGQLRTGTIQAADLSPDLGARDLAFNLNTPAELLLARGGLL
jgi:molybdopterin-guanine dinucleotide biosynthesis protein A